MADLVAGDLTYTLLDNATVDGNDHGMTRVSKRRDGSGYNTFLFAITTAAGEYPTGGLPLTNAKLGCPNALLSLKILEQDITDPLLTYHWDRSAAKIVIIEDDVTTGVPAEHANATITSPVQLIVEATGF